MQKNGRTNRHTINLGEAVLTTNRETEWMLKLRTVYPYGLNEKIDIFEDDKMTFKSDDGIVVKLFPSLPILFQRDQTSRYGSKKGISILSCKQFIINLHNYLKDDLHLTT